VVLQRRDKAEPYVTFSRHWAELASSFEHQSAPHLRQNRANPAIHPFDAAGSVASRHLPPPPFLAVRQTRRSDGKWVLFWNVNLTVFDGLAEPMRDPKDSVLKPLETNPARTRAVVLHRPTAGQSRRFDDATADGSRPLVLS
jgi:hypothetical protein